MTTTVQSAAMKAAQSILGKPGMYMVTESCLNSAAAIIQSAIDEETRELREALKTVLIVADSETNWRSDGPMVRQGTRYGIYLTAGQLERAESALKQKGVQP